MKKSIFIIMLSAILGACAGQAPAPQANNSLLSFAEIAAEIKVTYESLETAAGEEELVARAGTPEEPASP